MDNVFEVLLFRIWKTMHVQLTICQQFLLTAAAFLTSWDNPHRDPQGQFDERYGR